MEIIPLHSNGFPEAKIFPKPRISKQVEPHSQKNSSNFSSMNDSKRFSSNIMKMRNSKSSQRSVKRSNYLPRHIEGKFSVEEVRYLKLKLKKSDTACMMVSCIGLVFAWIENEIFFSNGNVSNVICHVLRSIVSITCLISQYLIFNHYKLQLEILKSRKIIYSGTSLYRSNMFFKYLVESIFNWIHCPPFLDISLPMEQLGKTFVISLDAYLSVIMLGRLYIFLRLFDHYAFWTGERAVRVCRINGFIPDSKFAIKAYLKYKSFLVLTLSLGISILLFGFAVRTFERPYISPTRSMNFDNIYNSFWCVVVTMTTIGYGDIYPQTHLGRLVIILACIWGIFILSLFVVALNNTTQLTKEESKAYSEISRQDEIKSTLNKDAVKIIVTLLRLNVLRKKKENKKKRILMIMDLMGMANRFRIKRKSVLNNTKGISELLDDIYKDLNNEIIDLYSSFQPLENIFPYILASEELQYTINDKSLQIYENSKDLLKSAMEVLNPEKKQKVVFQENSLFGPSLQDDFLPFTKDNNDK